MKTQDIDLTPAVERVILAAKLEAQRDESRFVDCKHLMIGLIKEGDNLGARLLNDLGVTVDHLRKVDWTELIK